MPVTPPGRGFTPRAQQALALSRKEADRLNHDFVDTGHLLLGMIKLGQGVHTAVFDRLGVNTDALKSAIEREMAAAGPHPIVGNIPYTPMIKKALALAGIEAREFNHSYVGTEHLLLGLMKQPEDPAGRVLRSAGLDLDQVRAAILEELDPSLEQTTRSMQASPSYESESSFSESIDVESEPKRPKQKRSESIGPETEIGGFVSGPAGYHSEYRQVGRGEAVDDYLDVAAQARQLAELIALRETKLPLAVGLFGNWGSGKSHFMTLMDQQIIALATRQRREGKSGPWCSEIVPIYFNAWHYLDSNLWASLITEIFERLFLYLSPKKDELEQVQQLLLSAGGAISRAEEQVAVAQVTAKNAQRELEIAKIQRTAAEEFLLGLTDGLKSLLPAINTPENRNRIARLLGVDPELATLSELSKKLAELKSIHGQLREIYRRATSRNGLLVRIGWLIGTIIIVPGLVWTLARLEPNIASLLQTVGPTVKTTLVGVVALVSWLAPALRDVRQRVTQLANWERQAEIAQENLEQSDALRLAKQKLEAANLATAEAEAKLRDARTHANELQKKAFELTPERRLSHFIEDRARSTEYRGQLGLISLARRDFQELSDLFANTEALRDKQRTLDAQEAERLDKLSRSIDRIVLFIDDLDRCQPETIVAVLQAVHLLLAFPLFAVVVGVDQRALKQSLESQFETLIGDSQKAQKDRRPATSLDYLEKIFHIPYHLPPMSPQAFGRFIEKLSEPERKTTEESINTAQARPGQVIDVPVAVGVDETAAPQRIGIEPIIGSVPLEYWERMALKDYYRLIRTPRAATRLLNTYRLLRAGIPAEEWNSFCGDTRLAGEFRIAMLLLAAAAGFPAVAHDWFERLRRADPTALFLDDKVQNQDDAWEAFKSVFDATFEHSSQTLTKELLSKWISRVERFSF